MAEWFAYSTMNYLQRYRNRQPGAPPSETIVEKYRTQHAKQRHAPFAEL
jgi:hypothetical protein